MDVAADTPREIEPALDTKVVPDASTPSDDAPVPTAEDPSVALVEVLPGVAVVFGDIPEALKLELVDFGLVPAADRMQLATLSSLVSNGATVGGNIANAMSSAQGLYRVSAATQSLLSKGAALAVKDGANLGSVWMNGDLVAQARFIPVSAVSAASVAASIGPAVAMVALQMQLNEISGLVRTSITLTTQVLGTLRSEQWAELGGHVAAIDRALTQAREIESVPSSLWDTVAGEDADLRKQLDLYRRHVGNHCRKIDQRDARARREYLEANAEAIVVDTHALLSSLKAWTGYKALQAGRARTAGKDDPNEARLVDVIVRDTRDELETGLANATHLVDTVTRELRLIAETTGPKTLPRTRKRKIREAARRTSADLLEAIEPLADALRPAPRPVAAPKILCTPKDPDLDPYLRVLRWILDQDETLRGLAFCYERDEPHVVALGHSVLSRIEPERWATLIAVTNRRVITARASELRREGRTGQQIPLEDVRYVRARAARGTDGRTELDVTTKALDLRWGFHADTSGRDIDALAGLLAQSMSLPEAEREALVTPSRGLIEAADTTDDAGAPAH